ncbi:hypothetical protein [Salimicrobium album]|uniref:Uncharacterized protein n=1 Tax=Salimicrobium album TaxID=50717 RepID=A0A1H3DCG1_9BACI|nr:hypothetical protein [Salimicrobium album]SDX64143.1 hypothetical protein SAMN04488081_0913 [Salimicrobium album]
MEENKLTKGDVILYSFGFNYVEAKIQKVFIGRGGVFYKVRHKGLSGAGFTDFIPEQRVAAVIKRR